ncbi:acetate--CoA ligase family protein (plasmid) [Sulfitobacter sp. W027]|uniref:acetate--CoA ligase family protein n=1 Tax=Sulfitobacter sp. W027 TaxID=2867025 RepID=UPI0021A7F0E5|nr:acetate--CoA ligase family protein [Sulfitobacter sp. W027]UWR35557.1 acetate--CoA ligase family protein [Sulfitobacter sp. W027]
MNKARSLTGLSAVFEPRSIAVVGASSDPQKTGGRPIHMLLKHGYKGGILPVNPKVDEVQGLKAYADLGALPQVPDLVLILVPGAAAVAVLENAAKLGVGAAIVLSAGFAENGPDGEALQAPITALADASGMRIVGPNCLGSVSVANCAIGTFSIALEKEMPRAGGISIASQSGNVGSVTLAGLRREGAGIARFIATGNEADIQAADAVEWMAQDDATRVILLVLETCRDGARLTRALTKAREAGKPVVVMKIGTSEAGQKAALSHTGGLAGSDRVFDAVFDRYGAVRVQSLEELVEVGVALETMGTRRIGADPSAAMVAASGGFGVMMADSAAANGIAVNPLTEATQARIKERLPLASAVNPIDATAQMSANPDILEHLVDAALSDPENSTVCLMLAMGMGLPRLRSVYTEALKKVSAAHPDKALVATIGGPQDAIAELRALGIVCFSTIDATMRGIAALAQADALRDTKMVAVEDVSPAPLMAGAERNEATAKAALRAAGLPFAEDAVVTTGEEAAQAAARIGGKLAMKILSPDILHKSDIGGVELNISGEAGAKAAFKRLVISVELFKPEARIDGVIMAPMTSGGTELILGTTQDPTFGPVIMVGLGGVFTEVFEDTALALAPVTADEAERMVRSLRAFALLDGARGRPKADLATLTQAIVDLSRFAVTHAADVAEIDINPILVRGEGNGAVALDALIVTKETNAVEAAE